MMEYKDIHINCRTNRARGFCQLSSWLVTGIMHRVFSVKCTVHSLTMNRGMED